MADSKPAVPHNFGEKYFNSKHHSNIEVTLKDGKKIKVNSMILVLNSPYFEELVEKRNLKTIEMDEFDAKVCKDFLKSLYTGKFETIDKENFRQVSKLSYTLQVGWMKEKCLQYFNWLVNAVPNNNAVEDDEFLLGEAIEAKSFDKDRQYLDALAVKKTSNHCIQDVVQTEKMLEDLTNISIDQLDFFIRLANKCNRKVENQQLCCNTHGYEYHKMEYSTVIVEKVTEHLTKLEKIDSKTRYILETLDFSGITEKFKTQRLHSNGYQDRFKMAASKLFQGLLNLKEISNDDMKMTLKHYMSLGN